MMSLLLALLLLGSDGEVSDLYELSTAGSTTRLKAGESGKLVIAIVAKDGAHISGDAPLKIELSSRESVLPKEKLTRGDAVKKGESRFEAVFTPTAQGPISVEAKLTFFVCAKDQCTRQVRTLSLPVEVL